jgi:hypothetical protein
MVAPLHPRFLRLIDLGFFLRLALHLTPARYLPVNRMVVVQG